MVVAVLHQTVLLQSNFLSHRRTTLMTLKLIRQTDPEAFHFSPNKTSDLDTIQWHQLRLSDLINCYYLPTFLFSPLFLLPPSFLRKASWTTGASSLRHRWKSCLLPWEKMHHVSTFLAQGALSLRGLWCFSGDGFYQFYRCFFFFNCWEDSPPWWVWFLCMFISCLMLLIYSFWMRTDMSECLKWRALRQVWRTWSYCGGVSRTT